MPLDAQAARDKVRAMSEAQRQAFLADTRWAPQAQASRALLERAVTAGDKLDEKSMLALDTNLRQAHHALAAAAGASFLEVLTAVQVDVFKTAEQRRAFETFVRKCHALRQPPAHDAARDTAGKQRNELPAHAETAKATGPSPAKNNESNRHSG